MDLTDASAVVTGGASGLGLATVTKLLDRGVRVTIIDLPRSPGAEVAEKLGSHASFVTGRCPRRGGRQPALDVAESQGPLRALVHCAGRGATVRVRGQGRRRRRLRALQGARRHQLDRDVQRASSRGVRMAGHEPVDGERGVCVLTASVAAWEGKIGQIPYASAKAGVVGMTLVAARDLAQRGIRVCSIAPGVFDTPILSRLLRGDPRRLGQAGADPGRLGRPDEFASTALHIIDNAYINGETIRVDGAIRMSPR